MKNCTIDLSDRLPEPKKIKPTRAELRKAQAEKVKAAFEAEGYTLTSPYVGSKAKIGFICPEGHHHNMSWDGFRDGTRCGYCHGRYIGQAEVEAAFNARGYTLKSQYKKNTTRLYFVCPNGHEHFTNWSNFSSGKGCGICAGKVLACKAAEVSAAFEAEGYTLTSPYVNSKTKIGFICPEGHHHSMRWGNFQVGYRCERCADKYVDHAEVEAAFNARGYTLKSQYKKNTTRLYFVCPNGHEHFISWSSFSRGSTCGICSGRVLPHEEVEAAFDAEGYTLKSKYESALRKLNFICPAGHHDSRTWASFKRGSRCSTCNPSGYDNKKPGILYYVRFTLPSRDCIYKIGITNQTVKKRFAGEKTPYTIVWQQRFKDGKIPQQMEREILKKHKKFKYNGNDLISGNTECFTRDVLGYDKPEAQLNLLMA